MALIAPYPALYFPVQRLIGSEWAQWGLLRRETELLISGFPRSANSWTVVAFREAQDRPVWVASHSHAEAQVIAGARRGLPVVVLIRRPADAIRSLTFRNPGLDPQWALRRWMRYYTAVERLRASVVLATFDQATTDLAGVVTRLNSRFGCNYAAPEVTEAYRRKVFAAMARDNIDNPAFAAVPDAGRSRLQQELELAFDPWLLASANALYDRLATLAT